MPGTALSRLPDQLAVFAKSFADTGDCKAAAIAAGCHPQRAQQWGRDALGNPAVRSAVEYATRSRFAESGPIALNVLIKFAKNEGDRYSPDHQLSAAKSLLDRSGYTAKDMRGANAETKDLVEMSAEELRHVLETAENELAGRAKQVDLSPLNGANSVQVIDLEG